jgi:hypothetical protein
MSTTDRKCSAEEGNAKEPHRPCIGLIDNSEKSPSPKSATVAHTHGDSHHLREWIPPSPIQVHYLSGFTSSSLTCLFSNKTDVRECMLL